MTRFFCVLLASCLVATACGRDDDPAEPFTESGPARDNGSIMTADPGLHVTLAPTDGQTASGMLTVSQDDDEVRIAGRISGLAPDSELGFHIHEIGDCSAPDASSAGEHFNPTGQPHGDPDGDAHHLGDMVNVEADDEGVATVDVTLDDVSIDGPADRSIRNRAIVLHARADDYKTQPSGDSGARIACGVIGDASLGGAYQPRVPGVMQQPGGGEPPAQPRP